MLVIGCDFFFFLILRLVIKCEGIFRKGDIKWGFILCNWKDDDDNFLVINCKMK